MCVLLKCIFIIVNVMYLVKLQAICICDNCFACVLCIPKYFGWSLVFYNIMSNHLLFVGYMFVFVTTSTICFWSCKLCSNYSFAILVCICIIHEIFSFFFCWCNGWNAKKVVFLMQYMLLFHIIDHFFKIKSYFFVYKFELL
jgi:hypothetical protein